tara:strand:+ start:1831 stop:2550 length:720 start_codon:yes stop_codon:yes gene_type:complete
MPVESNAESQRRNNIASMSYTDYLSNTEQVKKDIKLIMNKKIPSVNENYTLDLDETVEKAFNNAETHLIDVVSHLESIKKDIFSNLISNEHLDKASPFYENKTQELDDKMNHKIIAEEKVNKRMVNFYNKDSELKKDIIYYLKMLYVFLVFGFVAIIIYRREHKNKKLWGFIALLFLLPFYGIHKIYIFILENIGHFKLDVLYISLLVIILAVIFGLYKIGEMTLKQSSEAVIDNILNT